MRKIFPVVLMACILATGWAQAQTSGCDLPLTVIGVRHAERQDESSDSPLNARGWRQAAGLVGMLADRDITTIYVTDRRRTRQTALPIAEFKGVEVTELPADAAGLKELLKRLCTLHGSEVVLVVGHSNTLPEVFTSFGVQDVPKIGYAEVYELKWVEDLPVLGQIVSGPAADE